jgi:peptide-methionine (S)-S-oxide reductase
MRRLAVALALVVVVAACGGDDPDTSGSGDLAVTTTTTVTTTTAAQAGGEQLVAQEGDTVAVHYIGTLDDGTEFDSSRTRGATLDFQIGSGGMIAGFDAGVRGMAEGETKTIRIEPADAYGEYDPSLLVEVDIAQVPEGTVAGDVLVDPTTGAPVPVVSVEGSVVTLDLNHQLAGEALTFEIEMVTITR